VRVVAQEQVAEASGSDVLMAVDLTVVSDSECNLDYEEGEITEPIIPLDQVAASSHTDYHKIQLLQHRVHSASAFPENVTALSQACCPVCCCPFVPLLF
jgi:hypothetical protein